MATQRTQTPTPFEPGWTSLSGLVLAGGFELQEMVEADAMHARYKVRVLGDRGLDCTAECYRLASKDSAAQVEIWELARQLRHPDLAAPLGAGLVPLDGEQVAYAIVRRADESLSGVLLERALTPQETGEALGSVARALEALHVNGLVHGCLSPAQILAVGDQVKLAATCVRAEGVEPAVKAQVSSYLAPESREENLSPEADAWCLGATLFEALTQKRWTEGVREETSALPEPFRSIALRCLEEEPAGRARLGEVMALYRGELKALPRARAAAAGAAGQSLLPGSEIAPAGSTSMATVLGGHGQPGTGLSMAGGGVSPMEPAALAPEGSAGQAGSTFPATLPEREAVVPLPDPEQPAARDSQPRVMLPPDAPVMKPAVLEETRPVTPVERVNPAPKLAEAPNQTEQTVAVRPALITRPRWEDVIGEKPGVDGEGRQASRLWIWAAVALLIVLGLVWALRPKTQRADSKVNEAAAQPSIPRQPPAHKAGAEAWETRTLQPDGSASRPGASPVPLAPAPSASAPSASARRKPGASSHPATPADEHRATVPDHAAAAAIGGAQVWRVVLYTYSRQEDAQRKAEEINASKRGWHAEVFSPSGAGTPFLVTMAGRTSKDEAAQVRRKAVAGGMPHDAYIQNYSH